MANTEYRVDPELPDEEQEELDGWFDNDEWFEETEYRDDYE